MSKKSRKVLKTYFQTGDQPTESEFVNWFDSSLILSGSNGITGSLIISGSTNDNADGSVPMLYVMGDITSSGNISASGTIYANNFQSTGEDVAGITFADDMNLTGDITASGNISSSGTVTANEANITGHITASGNISASGYIRTNNIEVGTGSLILTQYEDDGDIIFKSDNNSGGTTEYLRIDGGEARTVVTRNMRFEDGAAAQFGAGSDLQIYHNATDSYIVDGGTGDLLVNTTAGDKISLQYAGIDRLNVYQDGLLLSGSVTASGNISASLGKYVRAGTGSFGRLEGLSPISVGDPIIFLSSSDFSGAISASGGLSASGDISGDKLYISGDITGSNKLLIQKSTGQGSTYDLGTSNVATFQNNNNSTDASIAIVGANTGLSQIHFATSASHYTSNIEGSIRYHNNDHASKSNMFRFWTAGIVGAVIGKNSGGKGVLGLGDDSAQGLKGGATHDHLIIQGTLGGFGLMISSSTGAGYTVDRGANTNNIQWLLKTNNTTKWALGNLAKGNDDFSFYKDGSATGEILTLNHATGHITASNNIRATGDIISQRYIVSSSVTHLTQSFSSGSTIFGDTQNDTHQFTGSLSTTGSITASGYILGKLMVPENSSIYGEDSTGNIPIIQNIVAANGTVFGNQNRVNTKLQGINTEIEGSGYILLDSDDVRVDGAITTVTNITASGNISSSGYIINTGNVTSDGTGSFGKATAGYAQIYGNSNGAVYTGNGHVKLWTNNVAYNTYFNQPDDSGISMMISSSGRIGIGTTTTPSLLTVNGDLTTTNLTASGNISASNLIVQNDITGSNRLLIQKSSGEGSPAAGTSDVAIFQNNTSGQDASIAIIAADDARSQIHFGRHDKIDKGGIKYFHNDHGSYPETMQFRVNAVQMMTLKGNNLGIGSDSNNPSTFVTIQGALSGGGLTVSSSNGSRILNKGAHTWVTIDRSATNKNGFIEFDTAGTTNWTLGNIAESNDNFYIYSGDATGDKHISLTSGSTIFHTNITSSNISSSGAIYSTNHESIYQASINCLADDASNWFGPNQVGLNLNTWNYDYGDDTAVLTLAQEWAHAGIIVPYKCKLIGFRAVGSPLAGSTTIELALYHEPAASATFNDTSGAAADATIVSVAAATSTSTDTAENPMIWSKLDATQELVAGDMLYPRLKIGGTAGANVTFTVLVQRIK